MQDAYLKRNKDKKKISDSLKITIKKGSLDTF